MAKTIEDILHLGESELKHKGDSAKRFVLDKKNNVVQSKKIIDFIS